MNQLDWRRLLAYLRINDAPQAFFLIFFFEVELIYNAVFVSAVQQSDSVTQV